MQDKLPNLDFEGKRLAFDMLGITVYLNDHDVEITGIIEPEPKLDIVHQSSRCSFSGSLEPHLSHHLLLRYRLSVDEYIILN